MSEYKDYVEQNQDEILSDFQKFICQINEVRRNFNLPDKVFSEKDREEFERQCVESRSI